MRVRGFSFAVSTDSTELNLSGGGNPYALLDVQEAGARGYGLTDGFLRQVQAKRVVSSSSESESPAGYVAALTGSDAALNTLHAPSGMTITRRVDGCVAIARARLYGDAWDATYFNLVDLTNTVVRRVGEDPRVSTALREWRACMSESGSTFDSPDEARQSVFNQLQSLEQSGQLESDQIAKVRASEQSLAVRDSSCQVRVGLMGQYSQVQAEVEKEYSAEALPLVDQYRTMMERAMKVSR